MKHYLDYKKLFKSTFWGILVLFTVFAVPTFFSNAQTAPELQNKIEQRNTDIEKLEKEIKQYQIQLNDLGKQKNSLAGSIAELDITRKKLNADISITQNKIDKTNFKIEGLGSQINTKEDSIVGARKAISLDIKKTNEFEQNSLVTTILSKDDFTSIWNDIDNMATIRKKIRERITELQHIKRE